LIKIHCPGHGIDRGKNMTAQISLTKRLAVWTAVPVVETYFSLNSLMRHETWQYFLEFLVFIALGILQWKFAKPKWLQSLLWPALIALFFGLVFKGPLDKTLWVTFYALGLALLTIEVMKDFEDKLQPRPAIALLVAIGAVVFLRFMSLSDTTEELDQQTNQLTAGAGARLLSDLGFGAGSRDEKISDGTPIIVISIDTLRADFASRMSSWKRLAALGGWWESPMSTSSWTLPSVASLVTGRMPGEHGAGCFWDQCQGLQPDVGTIAEALDERGYRTVAVTANPWLTEETGFARGFDEYFDFSGITPVWFTTSGPQRGKHHRQDGVRVVDKAIDVIDELPDRGFYLWVHLIDPHMPYLHADWPKGPKLVAPALRGAPPASIEARTEIINSYQAEVDHADKQVNRLLDALEERDLLNRAIIVFTSDHGEEFWEHGGVEHGHSHHREVIEIPLVIVGPGMTPGKHEGVASIVDVVPTIRAMIGLEPNGIDLREPADPARIATAYGNGLLNHAQSARDQKVKVIVDGNVDVDEPLIYAYDLENDPDEHRPWVPNRDDPLVQAALAIQAPTMGKQARLDTEGLKALGYMQ
jgi:arylsulfatase A-like enzyme